MRFTKNSFNNCFLTELIQKLEKNLIFFRENSRIFFFIFLQIKLNRLEAAALPFI